MKAITRSVEGVALKVVLFLFSIFLSVGAFAQQVEVNVNNQTQAWYTAWWVWVGLALFVIVLVSIVSSGRTDNR